jgi:hypothetical protein
VVTADAGAVVVALVATAGATAGFAASFACPVKATANTRIAMIAEIFFMFIHPLSFSQV